jgi:hypothetical protein
MSPCAASTYQINAYSQDEVSTASQRDLRPFFSTQTTERTIDVNLNFIRSTENMPNYFQVSALQNCAASAYLHDFFLNGKVFGTIITWSTMKCTSLISGIAQMGLWLLNSIIVSSN